MTGKFRFSGNLSAYIKCNIYLFYNDYETSYTPYVYHARWHQCLGSCGRKPESQRKLTCLTWWQHDPLTCRRLISNLVSQRYNCASQIANTKWVGQPIHPFERLVLRYFIQIVPFVLESQSKRSTSVLPLWHTGHSTANQTTHDEYPRVGRAKGRQ